MPITYESLVILITASSTKSFCFTYQSRVTKHPNMLSMLYDDYNHRMHERVSVKTTIRERRKGLVGLTSLTVQNGILINR